MGGVTLKIINRTNVTNALNNNYIKHETSILPMLITNPIVLVDWYHINKEKSELLDGLGTPRTTVISAESTIVFDKISNVPVGGIDSLLMESTYDEQQSGWTADYTADGFVFANTVNVTEHDYFAIRTTFNGGKTLLFCVTEHKRDYVKNMSIIQFEYKFAYDQDEKFDQLESQVSRRFTCLSSQIGPNMSFIIEEDKLLTLQDRINNYIEVTEFYKDLFYDQQVGNFFYRIPVAGGTVYYHDRVFNKILYRNRILFFDNVINFARSEFNIRAKILAAENDQGITDYTVNTSIIQQVINRSIDIKTMMYRQVVENMNVHISKYQKARIVFSSKYAKETHDKLEVLDFTGETVSIDLFNIHLFDDEFIEKIRTNTKYEDNVLRNIIIDIYNGVTINFDDIELEYEHSVDNFYLIPIILYEYGKEITKIFKS